MKRFRQRLMPVLGVFLLQIAIPALGQSQTSPANRLVLLSIDGLNPDLLSRAEKEGIALPALDALRSDGVSAEGMVGIYPTVTYPLHTSLVTGVRPARHGIVTNFKEGDWYIERSDIKVDTLWDAAERAGLKTAVVSWPVSFGADVDFLVPEYLGINKDPMPKIRSGATPGLLESMEQALGSLPSLMPFRQLEAGIPLDTFTTDAACWLLEQEKPDLMLLHYLDLDHRRHEHGPYAEAIYESLRFVDGLLSRVIEATARAGTRESTTFVVVGDHGFEWTHSTIVLDALFVEAGVDPSQLRLISDGGSAAVFPFRDGQAEVEERVEAYVSSQLDGLVRIVDRRQLVRLGAYPGALFALEAAPGFSLGRGNPDGPLLIPAGGLGAHGYLPSRDRMRAAFIASGPAVASHLRGVEIPEIRMVDVAPTLALMLGLVLEEAAGHPLAGLVHAPK